MSPKHSETVSQPAPIEDLVKIDKRGKGHRPDGKFLSTYEMNQVEAHADLIREQLPEGQLDQLSDVLSEQAGELETPDFPSLTETEPTANKLTKLRSFFGRRSRQLGQVIADSNELFQDIFSKEIAGVQITAGQWLRARLSPAQLGHNARGNLGLMLGKDYRYNLITDNPVIRRAFYKKALAGDATAANYLRRHDHQYGKREMTGGEAAKEALAIFSGWAVVRRIGLVAMEGATLAQLMVPSDKDPVRFERLKKLTDKARYSGGAVRFEKEQAAYAELARRQPRRHF